MREKYIVMVIIASLLVNLIVINPNINSTASNDVQISKNIDNESSYPDVKKILSNTPTAFTENHGQLENDEVRFYDQGGSIWFTDDGVWFELREYAETRDQGSGIRGRGDFDLLGQIKPPEPIKYRRVILKQEFVGANQVRPVGRERLSWDSNYFNGNDSSKWYTEVPNYAEIWFENIYDGIDLRYYTNERGLKYDFIVHPSGYPNDIRLNIMGADGLYIDIDGNLNINTELGNILDSDLYIYQNTENGIRSIDGEFIILNSTTYGFQLLDQYKENKDLIIDPFLQSSTYIGGIKQELSWDIGIDFGGNAYVSGVTNSSDFPTTVGVYDRSYNGGGIGSPKGDVFVFKLNSSFQSLEYSTYIGGNKNEYSQGIYVDMNGNTIITGTTHSSNFPTTSRAYDTTYNGQGSDVFVLKLNHNGSSIIYSTFIGGAGSDRAYSLDLDSFGNAYVTGQTDSSNFPTSSNAFDTSNGGFWDGFVVKLNTNGSTLLYSTYLGGSNEDSGYDIIVDLAGYAYITGWTTSSNFPNTTGSFDTKYNGGRDCFILKLNQMGTQLIYSTFVGGTGNDYGYGIDLDKNQNVFITGLVESSNFPTTSGAYDTMHNGNQDIFVLKMDSTGSNLEYSTFIGGSGYEIGYTIAVDFMGYAFVTGLTASTNFPTTSNAYDSSFNGVMDVIILKLNQDGSSLNYSSFFGGSKYERSFGIELDSKGNVFINGHTYSSDFPTTFGSFDTSFNGIQDIFVTKFYFDLPPKYTLLELYENEKPTNCVYTRYCPYTFRYTVEDDISYSSISSIKLYLDPANTNIVLEWDGNTNEFNELFDTHDYIRIESSSSARTDHMNTWIFDFIVSFNWTYPHEKFNNVSIYIDKELEAPFWDNTTNLFKVENDLEFIGSLSVQNSTSEITPDSWIRAGDVINWKGLKVVYEENINKCPPDEEFDVILWDENGLFWQDCNSSNRIINITSKAYISENPSNIHIINITGIPPECDSSNITYELLVDGFNVTFDKVSPSNFEWQTDSFITCNITCKDVNGSGVMGSSIFYRISTDNGTSWGPWTNVGIKDNGIILNVSVNQMFPDGVDNLIQWRASDMVGNGPNISEENRILVDSTGVEFSHPTPQASQIQNSLGLFCSINITDGTSGVNASTVEFAVKKDGENSWSNWQSAGMKNNALEISTNTFEQFNEGEFNFIKWRASDLAGNGPYESEEYQIKVDITNITFQNPLPSPNIWQTKSPVNCVISCLDIGLGQVNGSTISYRISTNNGTNWGSWKSAGVKENRKQLNVLSMVEFPDGVDNLIQWCGKDTIGNGPAESGQYRVLVDTEEIFFSNPLPTDKDVSTTEEIEVGITVSDNVSGVDASTVEYTISSNGSTTWIPWTPVTGLIDAKSINVTLNLILPNGTGNRIKWRASDIAGNGPRESKVYVIIVNTWLLEWSIPKVKLLSPPNGSIISSIALELSWRLTNKDLLNVNYDVYLDTVNPPVKINHSGIINTTVIIDNLSNGLTYYWTIIPRTAKINGSCESGVWSFTIIIPIPKINLISPENNSIINDLQPGLSWSVEYDGTEILSYNVYFGTSIDRELELKDHPSTNCYIKERLVDGETYYWKVVPWAGNTQGLASEIWSFTVKKEYIPHFELELFILPPVVELPPGDIRQVKAIVSNLGELEDSILLRIEVPPDSGVGANVDEPSIISVIPHAIAEFNIMVTTSMDAPNEEVILTVVASSRRAPEYDLIVEERSELTVKILDKEKKDEDNPWLSLSEFWIIFLIIIMILIVLIIVWVVLKQKKISQDTKDESTLDDAVTVRPETVPKAVLSIGQAPPTITSPQLPEISTTAESEKPTSQIVKVPTLASSTTPGQVPESQQMAQAAEVPQLLPAPTVDETTPTIAQTPSINPVSKVPIPGEQLKQPTPTLASTESPTQIQKSPTLAQPEKVIENVKEKS